MDSETGKIRCIPETDNQYLMQPVAVLPDRTGLLTCVLHPVALFGILFLMRQIKTKAKTPAEPVAKQETVRRSILSFLEQGGHSAKEISSEVRISEKEVYDHLEHLRKSTSGSRGHHLLVTPAKCKKCGFVFSKRERFKKPGRCPVCRGESIHEPLFSISKF